MVGIRVDGRTLINAQGTAQDIEEITGRSVEGSYNDPLPEIDFRWTWQTKNQAGFAYTINSLSNGFDRQRGKFEDTAFDIAASSLLTHHSNDVNLPFLVETANLDYQKGSLSFNGSLISTVFRGRAIWAAYRTGAVFAETSTSDSTPVQILSSYVSQPNNIIHSLKVATIDSIECLVVTTSHPSGAAVYAFSNLDPETLHFSAVSAVTPIGFDGWLLQVPLSKQPILVRQNNFYHLIRSDWGTLAPALSTVTLTNTIRGISSRLIGLGSIGGRPPYVYTIEAGGRIAYTDVYGMRFSWFQGMDLPYVYQAALVRNGLISLGDNRIIFYDGHPWDTRIFRDPEPVSGYYYQCMGFHVVEDTIFADVNLASTSQLGQHVDLAGVPNTKRQTWRLDFDRMRWSPVSEWTEIPNYSTAPAWGVNPTVTGRTVFNGTAPSYDASLPYGPNTRTLHYAPNQGGNLSLRKFEPPPGTSPYAIRGTKLLAADGTTQTPGRLFPKGPGFDATYLDKYYEGVYWGGQDTGGTGSYLRVRVAEHGRIENTNPNPQTAFFRKGVTHQGRWFPFNSNQAMLFPQEEYYINRGSDTMATLQALPVTYVGHVDLDQERPRFPWLAWGRSKG